MATVTMNFAAKNYRTVLGEAPKDYDLAVVSIDAQGTPDALNEYVLSQLGYKIEILNTLTLKLGYFLYQGHNLNPVLFIVTVSSGNTGINLKKNLTRALTANKNFLKTKNIWIPLMGTGSGGLEFVDSYDTTIGVIKQYPDMYFTISIPNTKTGLDFIGQFNIEIDSNPVNVVLEVDINEFQIDEDATLVYGQVIGDEIKDYDIIFLPKSSFGGVGNNSIATHILNLLGIDKNSINFSDKSLLDERYSWNIINVFEKRYYICFIITRDEYKEALSFEKQFYIALENFKKSENAIELFRKKDYLKIFVPFLGTGQAGMTYEQSFKSLLPGITNIRGLKINHTLRINYPLEFSNNDIENYSNKLLNAFKLNQNKNFKFPSGRKSINTQDKIPFHLDNVETIDRLNREPVAKSLARLINGEIFANKDLKHSFMIHLQGEWGSGKSTFLNLIKTHLETDNKKWVVVNFDSWQNQHISPPWWSFIDQVYRQAISRVDWFTEKPGLWLRESSRRIIWYSGWNKIMSLVISIILLLLLISYGSSMIKVIAELPAADNIDNSTKGLTLEVFAKLIVSIGSIVGLVYSLSKFLSTPFLMKSSGEAKSFMLRASDPMNRIKKHYNKLIQNINNEGYNVAIFIDDIDRCDRSYTISLLEGIQTLFKEKKVLFIVAGDKNWISTCFENNYKEFVNKVNKTNEKLGDLFLEKVFQLSIRMPNVSEKTKEKYWNHILGLGEKQLGTTKKSEITEKEREAVKQKVKTSYSAQDKTNQNMLNELETEYQLSEEELSDIAIEALDESTEDIRHLFSGHYRLINPNPRSVKRLANNYTMYRNTMIAERKDFNPNKLFRWLIIDDLYPALSNKIIKLENPDGISKEINEMALDNEAALKLDKLLFDNKSEHGGQLEIADIKDILGL